MFENGERNGNVKNARQTATLCISLILGLSLLLLGLSLSRIVSASGPESGSGHENGAVIGLASDALECLAVGNDLPSNASGVAKLTWQGQIDRARLVLSVSGAEAAHTIKVNGQAVALVPIYPDGQPCNNGEYFYLDVPPETLVQGDNLIEITNDALVGDSWTAANVRLEVLGDITVLQTGGPDEIGQIGAADVTAAAVPFIITFTNSYDGSSQEAMAQIPDGYDVNTQTPLVIAVHGRTSVMEWGIDYFGDAANDKGWLLASPQMHGSWPIPEVCYTQPYSSGCESDDRFLLDRPGAYAHASLESQYDIIGTVNYMVNHYNVKHDQIYLASESMGSQISTVTIAKYPHLFAAVFANKGITDLGQWYNERTSSYTRRTLEKECHIDRVRKTPAENLFCYERRSSVNFGSNYIHIPISMTHSISDALVLIHHSRDLRDAINSYGPDRLASVYEDALVGPTCDDGGRYHCLEPDPMVMLNFLEPFTLNNSPANINITTDESKSYHWLNIAQTGGDHWSRVEVTYYPISATVAAVISDTQPLTLGFNLGSTPMMGIIEQPGMGLPATTYLVKEGDNNDLHNYTSGYLTTTLLTTGRFSLTISAITVQVAANPTTISPEQVVTSTITALVKDQLDNLVPDDTMIEFSTTAGTFPDGNAIYTTIITGGQGQATTILTTDGPAQIIASVGSVTGSTSVDMIYPVYLPIIVRNSR